jgi:hypothetical protein
LRSTSPIDAARRRQLDGLLHLRKVCRERGLARGRNAKEITSGPEVIIETFQGDIADLPPAICDAILDDHLDDAACEREGGEAREEVRSGRVGARVEPNAIKQDLHRNEHDKDQEARPTKGTLQGLPNDSASRSAFPPHWPSRSSVALKGEEAAMLPDASAEQRKRYVL